MGRYVVKLPDVGEGVAEAEIVAWHVGVGDIISEDDPFVEVMTDKATVELPSPVTGTVTWLGAEVGDILAVGAELVAIDVDGQTGSDTPEAANAPHVEAVQEAEAEAEAEPATPRSTPQATEPTEPPPATAEPIPIAASLPATTPTRPTGLKPLAAPAVRRRAQAMGVDLADVTGTAPEGRVGHDDLDTYITRREATTVRVPVPAGDGAGGDADVIDDVIDDIKVVGLRRNIAKRMQVAANRIPHFTYVEEVDVTAIEQLRSELNGQPGRPSERLTVLPFLMRAVVVAIADHPEMNARFDDEAGVVRRHRAVHIGIAVQTPKGLMVPVVKHADARDLWANAAEITRLSEAARSATVSLEELGGSTITITSLGALGGVVSTPIINYPEVAIIGVNKIVQRPVYIDGTWRPRPIMNLSSSFDHRVVDGWDAARFIQRVKSLLEVPALMFLQR